MFREPDSLVLNAHSHNDYLQPTPLFDALAQGFGSVEADIFLEDNQLLVAHERSALTPERTLEGLYLQPLAERVKRWGGVYEHMPHSRPFVLLIDVKDKPVETYTALDRLLRKYEHMLTCFEGNQIHSKALTIVLTGSHDNSYIAKFSQRLVTIDATFKDLTHPDLPTIPPLFGWLSDDWSSIFRWSGDDPISHEDREKLVSLVQKVHNQGLKLRWWGGPDVETAWKLWLDSGSDIIGTDNLSGLRAFLISQQNHHR
ncbi:putative secreted protein [Basidiobolus meristosporus CBS 931.73]|uniref:Altered inheritance of mitochondria protein 6 n=1 Tax=Basidiobolus meristosporus CBS 931.73 TaxID=1314790 RepID=A0A1Y1Y8G4_9FUNG|nr:putative secreted protein [Basidiobolus meristosporus CBS 931.73]|eukprot:ORX94273.1 putative secreted protein [Basidiobolus meristosporus CBS 931.73]